MRSRKVVALALVAATSSCGRSAGVAAPATIPAAASAARRVGTMSELMVDFIYPASDAVFYISSRTPATSEEWMALQGQTLMLAEAANLLMMPGRARDQERWMADAALMLDAGEAAYRAAKARDVAALEALSDPLYESCVTCHTDYRLDYGR
ncbi:MAG: hypothetical protein AB7T31_01620 [Gemmatimonadales bacterium]